MKAKINKPSRRTSSVSKNQTKNDSLMFFRQGKSIPEIASLRGLSPTTIESHLAEMVFLGEIELEELVTSHKAEVIKSTFLRFGSDRLAPIKEILGEEYTYAELKAVQSFLKRNNN